MKLDSRFAGARRLLALVLGVGAVCLSRPAEAKLLDIWASGRAGGVVGWGMNKINAQASDFFEQTRGPAAGVEVGAEVFLIDVAASFTQIYDAKGAAGTISMFTLGLDGDFALDDRRTPHWYLRLGGSAGVALGTHRPVDPPLSNDQVSDKGFVMLGTAAVDYHVSPLMIIAFEAVGGYHYFFAGGDAPVNQPTNQSQGMQLMGFLTLRFHWEPGLKR